MELLFHIAHCRIDVYSALQTEKKHLFASGSSEMRQIISIQKPTPCEQNGFTHFATALVVGSLASEFLGWSWKTHVGIPMLDIGIPMSEFQCPT